MLGSMTWCSLCHHLEFSCRSLESFLSPRSPFETRKEARLDHVEYGNDVGGLECDISFFREQSTLKSGGSATWIVGDRTACSECRHEVLRPRIILAPNTLRPPSLGTHIRNVTSDARLFTLTLYGTSMSLRSPGSMSGQAHDAIPARSGASQLGAGRRMIPAGSAQPAWDALSKLERQTSF